MGSWKEDGVSPFTKKDVEETRGKECKLHQEKFHLNIRNKVFTVRTTTHCNNLLRDVIESPSTEVFKSGLKRVIDNFI